MECKVTAINRTFTLKTKRMSLQLQKPVIGISVGDLNGIGTELIIKTFSDHRLLELCTPLIFASNKLINFYRKSTPEINFAYQSTKDYSRIAPKQINIFNCKSKVKFNKWPSARKI